MKILVLQIARLGDIYQSWPALRGLQRRFPDAKIDVMVRPRFGEALVGLEVVNRAILLPSQELLTPLVGADPNISEGIERLDAFLRPLQKESYDLIVNLSFSPLSSFLVHSIKAENTEVLGYTRHSDGYFNLIGDVSSYFYAQVGTDRHNRIHLTDLMSAMVGCDLQPEDWKDSDIGTTPAGLSENYVVFHIGASETHKSLPAFKWSRLLKYFSEYSSNYQIVLIGSKQERSLSETIVTGVSGVQIRNLVGETKIPDLFPVIRKAKLLVGCDSAPMHIAGLTKTPCLNISIGKINFWETGPRAPQSYILKAQSADEIVSDYAAAAIRDILAGSPSQDLIRFIPEANTYEVTETEQDRFCWDLIAAIYLGSGYPVTDDIKFFQGIEKLNEINNVILEQLPTVKKVGLDKMKPILDRADEVIQTLGDLVPELQIFVRWLKAERAKMSPGSLDELIVSTVEMHMKLKELIKPYVLTDVEIEQGGARG